MMTDAEYLRKMRGTGNHEARGFRHCTHPDGSHCVSIMHNGECFALYDTRFKRDCPFFKRKENKDVR